MLLQYRGGVTKTLTVKQNTYVAPVPTLYKVLWDGEDVTEFFNNGTYQTHDFTVHLSMKIEVIINYMNPASGYDLFYAIPRFTAAGNDVSDTIEIIQDTVVISDASEPSVQHRTKYTFDAEMRKIGSIGNYIILGDFSIAFMDGDTYEDTLILYGGTARFN